ncbi:ABC transporter substrate-binding protein [Natronorubrum halophilum]|uniref:ABC transporter substrate-binding protein n=1 Tax=Natronorubrum halophilum TaxID=1702106 RepID=UPI000EF666D3|nr:ABC transporter substrate-binding protein [Natronorubrum halophilum]
MEDVAPSTTRRGLLAGIGVGTSALAGCAERLWSQAETSDPEQVSLTIKTVPADDDRLAATIASQLRENYVAAGIDATHEPVSMAELYRDILLEGNYDVFVARHDGFDEYDALRGLLHSQFVSEQGWQNPFQFSDITVDDYLEEQRMAEGDDRLDVLIDLIDHLLETTPYTVVAHPYPLSGLDNELSVPNPPRRPHQYLDILTHPNNESRNGPLEVGVFGEGLTERLNPLTVDQNRIAGLLGLLYDPLVRRIDEEYVPWLAEDVEWTEQGQLRARVTLREGLEWHDGTDLDADDVAFTLDFLEDTSMGSIDSGAPAPRYRGRQTLVDRTNVINSRTISLFFTQTNQSAARRALTIPLLPTHIWADRAEVVTERQTQAIMDDNSEPIGSGLFAFGESTTDAEIQLEPFDAHVLREATDRPSVLENSSRFDGITFQVDPNAGSMVDALVNGEVDVTASELPPESAGEIRKAENTATVTGTSDAFYMIGYSSHHPQLGNPHFRRICSRLIDREHAVTEFFDGLAEPATSANALVGIRDDAWEYDHDFGTASDPLEFPGTDGEINASRVQSLFSAIHYRYEDDILLE